MFFLSIYVVVVFILFWSFGFVLQLEMCFYCPILFFSIFQLMTFNSFFAYILMRDCNFSTKLLIILSFSLLVDNRLIGA